jgi:hypothetical protein
VLAPFSYSWLTNHKEKIRIVRKLPVVPAVREEVAKVHKETKELRSALDTLQSLPGTNTFVPREEFRQLDTRQPITASLSDPVV